MEHKPIDTIVCPRCKGCGWIPDHTTYAPVARYERKRIGAVLKQVAKEMNISLSYMSELEQGRRTWDETLINSHRRAISRLESGAYKDENRYDNAGKHRKKSVMESSP
jgi:hypothetical protein